MEKRIRQGARKFEELYEENYTLHDYLRKDRSL